MTKEKSPVLKLIITYLSRKKWDVKIFNSDKFINTLTEELEVINTTEEQGFDINDMSSSITTGLNNALKASSKLIPVAPPKKRNLPKEVRSINEDLKQKGKEKSNILKTSMVKVPILKMSLTQ